MDKPANNTWFDGTSQHQLQSPAGVQGAWRLSVNDTKSGRRTSGKGHHQIGEG